MNQDQVLGIFKIVLPVFFTYAVGRGWISESSVGEEMAAVLTLIAASWSWKSHTDSSKLASVEAMPQVQTITVDRTATDGVADAAADPARPKVVNAAGPNIAQGKP